MFKKIRRNFIIIAMSSITLILLIFNVVINVVNFNSQVSNSDRIISLIEKDLEPFTSKINSPDPRVGDSRYFIVDYIVGSDPVVNLDHVEHSIITKDTAISYANEVVNNKSERGYKNIYRYHYSIRDESSSRVVFLDCQRSIQNYSTYILITSFSSLGALVVFFLALFFGSKIVLKPVKESYERQNRFITNASHELKTPLTIISANNELIEMKKGSNEYSKNIGKQVIRMNKMIKDLTSLSKLNENRKVVFETINISNELNEALKIFKIVCEEKHLKLIKHVDNNIYINSNKEYIKQIISIILDNAHKYSKSIITVELKSGKLNTLLKVSNDSENMIEGNLIKYTERFYRDEKIRSAKEGSGIGLSLLSELVSQTNGKLKIYGIKNTFNIEIALTNKNKVVAKK